MRKTDIGKKVYFRSEDRIICQGSHWYFESREGDYGPFDSREQAERELKLYIETMQFVELTSKAPRRADWSDLALEGEG